MPLEKDIPAWDKSHDHLACVEDAVAKATCAEKGVRLT